MYLNVFFANLFVFSRVDFMPAPKGGMVRSPGGCLRCGHSVYEAEKLIAAGRVSKTHTFSQLDNDQCDNFSVLAQTMLHMLCLQPPPRLNDSE